MRRTLAAALVAAALALAVPVQAQTAPQPIVVDASAQTAASVNLVTDALKSIHFKLDEGDFIGTLDAASVRLRTANEPAMELALQKSGAVWSTVLPVSTPDLVKGTWTATFTGVRTGGSGDLATVTLQVAASDTQAPKLTLAEPAQTVILGPSDSVALNVSDTLLRRVTYTFGGLPDGLPLAFPYVLRGDLLPQGQSTVVFQATDRAGQSTTLTVVVDRDAVAPRIDLQVPEHAYAGAPLTFVSLVREDGPHTLRLLSNGSMVREVKIPGYAALETNRTHAFTVEVPANGTVSLQVEVIDRAGNHAMASQELPVEPPIVDAKADGVRIEGADDAPLYVQDLVRLNATAAQVGGVAVLPLTVSIEVAGRSSTSVVDVGPGQSKGVTWESRLPAGRHTVHASVSAPASANETAPGNENATLAIEVFLGRVSVDGKRYDIRASDTGLPSAALESGSTKTYPLKLVDSGSGVAYQFTTSANQTYTWDPLKPMDDRDVVTESGTSSGTNGTSTTGGGKGAPAPGVVLAVLVVAVAAVTHRRRR